MIKVTCQQCSQRAAVPDHYAGRTIKCPKCQTGVFVPHERGAPAANVEALEPEAMGPSLAELEREIEQAVVAVPQPLPPRQIEPPALPRALAPIQALDIPDYGFLKLLGHIWVGIGIATFILGVGSALAALMNATKPNTEYAADEIIATGAMLLGTILSGAFGVAMGQGILALRDIARNSWRTAAR